MRQGEIHASIILAPYCTLVCCIVGLPLQILTISPKILRLSQQMSSSNTFQTQELAHATDAVTRDAAAAPAPGVNGAVSTPTLEFSQPRFTGGVDHSNASSPVFERAQAFSQNASASIAEQLSVNGNGAAEMSRSNSVSKAASMRNARSGSRGPTQANGEPHPPVCFPAIGADLSDSEIPTANGEGDLFKMDSSTASTSKMVLEMVDGSAFQGFSFGAKGKSISGECVFQTGKSHTMLVHPPERPSHHLHSGLQLS